MPIDFGTPELTELVPKIAVIGVGGAGCNAVNNMIRADLQGVDFIVANTDAQSLSAAVTDNRIQLGVEITRGLGAGAQPSVGEAAAEESVDAIDELLEGYHMAFITAGMGGGTGTGAAPVIARRAREKGVLTVGVVTKPFQFEGARRMKLADAGIAALAEQVDTLIIIPNQNLFRVSNERTTFADAFNIADDVLHSGVRGVTDLMVMPGLINLDFADVRTVMSEMGKAMMGTGEADGEARSAEAASAAIANPLLEESSLKGAKGVIINVTGGMDMTLFEVDEAVNMVREQVDPEALIVFGSAFNPELEGKIRVSVVATGIAGNHNLDAPMPQRSKSQNAPDSGKGIENTSQAQTSSNAERPEKAASDRAQPAGSEYAAKAENIAREEDLTMRDTIALASDQPSSPQIPEAVSDFSESQHAGETLSSQPYNTQSHSAQSHNLMDQRQTGSSLVDDGHPSIADEEAAALNQLRDNAFRADRPMQPKATMTSFRPTIALRSANDGREEAQETLRDADAQSHHYQSYAVESFPSSDQNVEKEQLIMSPFQNETEPTPVKKGHQKRRSLFQLMASGLKGTPSSEPYPPQITDQPTPSLTGQNLPVNRAKAGPVASNYPRSHPQNSSDDSGGDGGGTGHRENGIKESKDQLEIPSFLKKQQN